MKIDINQNSELGKFKLISEEGKKLRTFVDFESKLLIVSESPIDISNIPHATPIPTQQYIIDRDKKKALSPTEWKEYFNYNKFEIISKDGKYKEIIQRIHEPENHTDSLKYNLIDLENEKKVISNGTSIAFNERPRTSSIDRHYEHLESRKKYLASLELGNYPKQFYQDELQKLNEEDIIIQYYNEKEVYELKFEKGIFSLNKTSRPNNIQEWNTLKTKPIKSYRKLDEFWLNLTQHSKSWMSLIRKHKPWFMEYKLRLKSFLIEKFIIEEHNRLVQSKVVAYDEYQHLQSWMNVNFNHELERNVFWQFCSNCRERVFYNPRYPNHACRKCVDKIRDSRGNKLDYRDRHELKYIDGKNKLILKENNEEVDIYINDVEYFASEAKFGGVVHQIKE